MTRVLLVTGARSLADDPAAEAWARGKIAEALRGVDLLIVGDAPGPDAWAWDEMQGSVRRYFVQGDAAGMKHVRNVYGNRTEAWFAAWTREPRPRGGAALRAWILSRNEAMVADAAGYTRYQPPIDVRCLALLDGRKPAVVQPGEERPTRGTEHTARFARNAGLTVDAQTWGSR